MFVVKHIAYYISLALPLPHQPLQAHSNAAALPNARQQQQKKGKIFYSSQKQITILVQKFISSDNIFCFVQLRAKKKQKEMEMSFLYA